MAGVEKLALTTALTGFAVLALQVHCVLLIITIIFVFIASLLALAADFP